MIWLRPYLTLADASRQEIHKDVLHWMVVRLLRDRALQLIIANTAFIVKTWQDQGVLPKDKSQ